MTERDEQYVINLCHSPHARLHPAPFSAVRLTDAFWEPRRSMNWQVTLPSQYRKMEETGRIDNFRRASGAKKDIAFQGYFFNDSDVYKWLEAVAWSLASQTDAGLEQQAAALIEEVAAAQSPDGYLNTYFTFEKAGERWTNLADMHELYCAGHLIQAAIAYRRATGQSRLLEIAIRFADYICSVFGPGLRPGSPGHPEVEMALVELSRETGDDKYRRLAQFFLDSRGQGLIGGATYHLDHKPFREMDHLVGHVVRALYLCCGAADLYAESGEAALLDSLERLWRRAAERQTYLTGGLGARYEAEGFGEDFELPSARAYAETCAAIASVMWSWRMLHLTGEAQYTDALERALYNGVLSGIGLDGQSYFYVNPLADDGNRRRKDWFLCACCPPNVARLLAELPAYFYSLSPEGAWIHLYAQSSARLSLPGGDVFSLSMTTAYPWEGEIQIDLREEVPAGIASIFLRIPGWTAGPVSLQINGQEQPGPFKPGSYAEIRRLWQPGDQIMLHLPTQPVWIEAHPHLTENIGMLALQRGPLVYCIEGVDHPGIELRDAIVDPQKPVEVDPCPDLLGGIYRMKARARVSAPDSEWQSRLYRPFSGQSLASNNDFSLTAIPYYAWANRQPGPMQVWMRRR